MRVSKAFAIIVMASLGPVATAVAQPAELIANVRVVATAATHLQLNWEGQAEAYRVKYGVYGSGYGEKIAYGPVVARGPVTLVTLTPETQYVLRVQALEPEPEETEEKASNVIDESKPLAATTGPWQPREWENLLLWPSRHVPTFPGGTTFPAVAAYEDELVMVECYERAIHVSRIDPETVGVLSAKLAIPAEGKWRREDLDAVVVKDTLWLTWLEPVSGGYRHGSRHMIASYDLQSGVATGPLVIAGGLYSGDWRYGCELANSDGEIWVLWTAVWGGKGTNMARYDPFTGLQQPSSEWCVGQLRSAGAAAVELAGELFVTGLMGKADAQVWPVGGERWGLWAVRFNGQDFYEQRMLRGRGWYSSPTGAAVGGNIVVGYAKATQEELSDIDITLTSAEGGEVTSTSYIRDGTYNSAPDMVALGDAIYLVYNKWSATPHNSRSVNHGTYLAKIELKH